MTIKQSKEVLQKFDTYPPYVCEKLLYLRKLIIETAQLQGIERLEETLKWGEPSYLVKKGSTIRMDWKEKSPNQYALYFKCTSKLVPTFKELYGDIFRYEKTRALLFDLDQKLPENEIKDCIAMALTYHTIKDQPLLGRSNSVQSPS